MTAGGVYKSCNKAIKAMDRENLAAFSKLKMADWDDVHILRAVITVYRECAQKARKRYRKVARDAYAFGLMTFLLIDQEEAEKAARKAITNDWVDNVLSETDFVTLYRFDTEMERKAHRLAEQLEVDPNRNKAIDKALRDWARQLGQYAINMTDYALIMAYQDYGVDEVVWETAMDERVCGECDSLDGKHFKIDEIPSKPHWNCRCTYRPVLNGKTV